MIRRKREMVELVYPCRCSCGRRGHFVVGLHVLVFGYLLASVAFLRAARRPAKSSTTVYPRASDLVSRLLDDFSRIATTFVDERTIDLTEHDRRSLGLSDEDWERFRRRMGYRGDDNP